MAHGFCFVDNRTFLLGLDYLYRETMKRHERGELLVCARCLATALDVAPADVPIEGYYADDQKLTEYFRLVRALQAVDERATPSVDSLPQFQRLRDVTTSPLYGCPQQDGKLLPVGRDALSRALVDNLPEWNVQRLTAAACAVAQQIDDISLVGLAALVQDAVVLTALRESVVLYAEWVLGGLPPPNPKYVWLVDKDLTEQARRFIDTFNALFDESLPPPEPAQAERYWHAFEANEIEDRCVRLGCDDTVSPPLQYHWAIYRTRENIFAVQEFWHSDVWTTARYHGCVVKATLRETW